MIWQFSTPSHLSNSVRLTCSRDYPISHKPALQLKLTFTHSRLIPMFNASFILWPPSFSPIKNKLLNDQMPEMRFQPLKRSLCLATQPQLGKSIATNHDKEVKNSKTWPVYLDSCLLWIHLHNTNCNVIISPVYCDFFRTGVTEYRTRIMTILSKLRLTSKYFWHGILLSDSTASSGKNPKGEDFIILLGG